MICSAGKRTSVLKAPGLNIVTEGDSNTAGVGSWPDYMGEYGDLLIARGYPNSMGENHSVGGNTWTNLIERGATVDASATGSFNVLVVMNGTNDRYSDGIGHAAILARFQTWLNARVAADVWDMIIKIQVPALSHWPEMDADLTTYNAALSSVTAPAGRYYVVDRPSILDDSDNLTYYADDYIHYTNASQIIMANRVIDLLERRI